MSAGPEVLLLILADLGTDYRCYKIAMSLRKLGYRPKILCDRPRTPLGKAWQEFDVEILTPQSHFLGFMRAFFIFHFRVTRILLSTQSKIWIVEDGTPLFWAALIGKIRGCRVIYDAREILLETPAIRNRPLRRWLWSCWLWAGERLATSMLTVSPGFLSHYSQHHPNKPIFLLPNVPMLSTIPKTPKPALTPTVRLIYQGALRPESGLAEVLLALSQAPEYELDVFGSGPEAHFLRAETIKLSLEKRVRFHGSVPFEQLKGPIQLAHIGLHLLHPTCLSFDLTLSNKIFDYLHGGTPTLFSRTTGHALLLETEPIGVMAPSFSPVDILSALTKLRTGYVAFLEEGLQSKQRWSWEFHEDSLVKALGGFQNLRPQ